MGWMDKEISRRCSADSYFILFYLISSVCRLDLNYPMNHSRKLSIRFLKEKQGMRPI